MPKVPRQPSKAVLEREVPAWFEWPDGKPLWRVYRRGGDHPTQWNVLRHTGPLVTGRCDHHDGSIAAPSEQAAGVLYAGDSPRTCLAECFQERRSIDRRAGSPALAAFSLTRPLKLLDCTGSYLTRMGASLGLFTGERGVSRTWTRGLYAAHPAAEGLVFRSSMHAEGLVVVLNEQAQSALPQHPRTNRPLIDPALHSILVNDARALGYVLR